MQGYNDAPIKSLNSDLFNVKSYVNGLCKFIMECETPMTVSIQGNWGSGKTSMMNMIQSELGGKILPIWFNTWQFSQFQLGNSLAVSMLEVLLKKLGGDTKILDKIAGETINVLTNIVLALVENYLGSGGREKIEDIISKYTKKSCVQEITELKLNFEEAINTKVNASTEIERVVVFVDDLDRLEPAKAIELLEVLKLFIDCKNCVFVLAVDYEVVTLGIRQKYGSDINAAKGKSFFDKIIQLPFKMPVAQYDIEKYTKSMLDRMQLESRSERNVELFSALIKTSVGLNPRGMKRLFNTYQLLYNVIRDKSNTDNSAKDAQKYYAEMCDKLTLQRGLFAVVCMQMSFEAVYDYLLAGNLDVDTLKSLAAINDKAVNQFLKQRTLSETIDAESLDDNILNAVFNSKVSNEELRETLQKLPAFIKNFISAINTNAVDKLSQEEIDNLRNILKNSAITSVKPADTGEAVQRAVELRQKNRQHVQSINEKLKSIGDFKLLQDTRSNNGIISTLAAGYCIYIIKGKKYQLRYVLDYTAENKISLSIYLNGYEQNPQEFYSAMGDNPLGYEVLPKRHTKQGWYFYDNLVSFDDSDEKLAESAADKIKEAHETLKEKLGNDLEPYNVTEQK